MSLKDFITRERELLERATKGPWERCEYLRSAIHEKGKCSGAYQISCLDNESAAFIANVRTSHEKALQVIEILSEVLKSRDEAWIDIFDCIVVNKLGQVTEVKDEWINPLRDAISKVEEILKEKV